ncbi:MAG: Asp-tRNA(Asn)/Glu-tRNA(Gln) amidotransferase subunit GatA [Elusimicrobia bacterium]|nr:Asp-tRNA(Asn)/Glu-tRNA(Gln) amidotransferase subunit GatA [Elusimicrobiota bacterium]
MGLFELSAAEIVEGVRSKKFKAEEVVRGCLDRIRKVDGKVKAFLQVLEEEALTQAKRVDEKISQGKSLGRLAGVPVAIKDLITIKGTETTCGSKILKGFVAPYDATVVKKLQAEDAVFVGKTNMDEFAMGSSTENSAYFSTRNPWNLECVPGGSSGGSAASVAAGMSPLSLGSDTGGSIRQPAALCGVVGLKPTYGLVSRYGLVAFASSLDQIGPFSRTVRDCATILSVIAGHDPSDSTSAPAPPKNYLSDWDQKLKGIRIGLPEEYFIEGLDKEVGKKVEEAISIFKKMGLPVKKVSLPHTQYAVSTYYILAPSEASANLARYDGIRYGMSYQGDGTSLLDVYEKTRGQGFGPEVKRRIMLGTYALSSGYYDAYYGKAQRVRTLIKKDFEDVFGDVDLLITPTSPTAAFKLKEKVADPLQMYLSDIFTIPCNLAGIAGISFPCGQTSSGLPVGLQILGRPFEEELLLRAAAAYEKESPWPKIAQGLGASTLGPSGAPAGTRSTAKGARG